MIGHVLPMFIRKSVKQKTDKAYGRIKKRTPCSLFSPRGADVN